MPYRVEISDTDWREIKLIVDVMDGVEEPTRLQIAAACTRAVILLKKFVGDAVDLTCSGCGQVIRDAHACPGRARPAQLMIRVEGPEDVFKTHTDHTGRYAMLPVSARRLDVLRKIASHRGTSLAAAARFLEVLRGGLIAPTVEIDGLRTALTEAGLDVEVDEP